MIKVTGGAVFICVESDGYNVTNVRTRQKPGVHARALQGISLTGLMPLRSDFMGSMIYSECIQGEFVERYAL